MSRVGQDLSHLETSTSAAASSLNLNAGALDRVTLVSHVGVDTAYIHSARCTVFFS